MGVDISEYCERLADAAKIASSELLSIDTPTKNRWLESSADALIAQSQAIIDANRIDMAAAEDAGLSDAQKDRLLLTRDRIEAIAKGLRQIALLPDPVGEMIHREVRPNGLEIKRVRVPLGVVFFIYESRPNVTADASAICVKSGNAVILRGGKEAQKSSQSLVDVLHGVGKQVGIPENAIQLVSTSDRGVIDRLLTMSDRIDLAIPRGGLALIERVAKSARMPVMKHFDGNCHVYVDRAANLEMAVSILVNSKCQRMGVCNACESLLVHADIADTFLPLACEKLSDFQIEIRGDERVCEILPSAIKATQEDWGREYLGPILSARIVGSTSEAIEHVNRYGSHHTDAIVTDDPHASEDFLKRVDSAAVIANASTRFNDGGELGLGAEIGISTDKFHARGPCGLRELTSYKYTVVGTGQTRT